MSTLPAAPLPPLPPPLGLAAACEVEVPDRVDVDSAEADASLASFGGAPLLLAPLAAAAGGAALDDMLGGGLVAFLNKAVSPAASAVLGSLGVSQPRPAVFLDDVVHFLFCGST
jgi:hypothetical protein